MEFHVDDDRKVDHPHGMKLIEAFRMAYIDELGADVLEMPYKVSLDRFRLAMFDKKKRFFRLES